MWKRTIEGRALHFHLAGINNQNFLMRDEETGSYWQQVSGKAIFGPMRGRTLELVQSDELTFALWQKESPQGTILAPGKDADKYDPANWEQEVGKLPTVVNFDHSPLQNREIVLGLVVKQEAKAYPLEKILRQQVVLDRVGGDPIVLVTGPDGKSVRAFLSKPEPGGQALEFFRRSEGPWALVDSVTGSEWNFQGCAISGAMQGKCLHPLSILKDYWFDWRLYHPATTIYNR